MRKILLFALMATIVACSNYTNKVVTVKGSDFIDKSYPELILKFPFELSILEKKYSTEYDERGNEVFVKNYVLKSDKKNKIVVISKQNIKGADRSIYFNKIDYSKINNKFYFKNEKYGFCTVYYDKKYNKNIITSKVVRYSGLKNLATIEIIESLGKNYNADRLLNEDEDLVQKYVRYTEDICGQVNAE